MAKEKVKCENCDKSFRDRYNLWRHFMRKHYSDHDKRSKPKSEKPKPTCALCGHVFYKNGNLKRHSSFCKKSRPKDSKEYTFNSMLEFENWKKNVENDTKSHFVKKSHYKLQSGSFRTKYCCHRSGFFKPQGKNIRRLKGSGSNKINAICPAKIICIAKPDGKVEASFFSQHNGHSMEIERIPLTKSDRAELAEKIAENLTFKEILYGIKKSAKYPDLKRIHLITKKDLHNIGKEFNVRNGIGYSENISFQSLLDKAPNEANHVIETLMLPNETTDRELIPYHQMPPDIIVPDKVIRSDGPHSPELEHQAVFIVDVPCSVDGVQEPFDIETNSLTEQCMVERLKNEMRREFELVLKSIQTEEEARNGKKWMSSFQTYVHQNHVPIQIMHGDEIAN